MAFPIVFFRRGRKGCGGILRPRVAAAGHGCLKPEQSIVVGGNELKGSGGTGHSGSAEASMDWNISMIH